MSSEHLAAHREALAQQKITDTKAAISKFVANGTPLSVSDVAREAGVSRSFIYRQPEAKAAYEAATAAQERPATEPASTKRLRAENARLRERLREEEKKTADLTRQLRRQWGGAIENVPEAELTQRVHDLEDRLIALGQQNRELEVAVADQERIIEQQEERLTAQATLMRETMKAANR